MKIKIIIYAVIFFQCFVLGLAKAEEILSLDKALLTAYDNNPRMIEARRLIDAAKGDFITQRTLSNPEVEFEIGGLKKNQEGKRKIGLDNIGLAGWGVSGYYTLPQRKDLTITAFLFGDPANITNNNQYTVDISSTNFGVGLSFHY